MFRKLLIFSLMLGAQAVSAAPQSWKQLAQQALMEGNRRTAIAYYEKWAEADPADAVSLYNLACCYALENRTRDALKALAQSTAAGWSDSTHALMDPDLASLRREKEFRRALDAMASNARQRSGGYTWNVATQGRMGRYIVVLPDDYDPAQTYPLVVLLHGYGSTPERFAAVTPHISPRDFIFIVPEAPYTALDSEGKGYSHLREREDYSEDAASAAPTADWVVRAADDAMQRYPVRGTRFYVVGFSQGAALAHATAARHPDRVAGYAAHGGYILKDVVTREQLEGEKAAGTRVLITHGKEDRVVGAEEGVYASSMLTQAGLDVTFELLDVPHVFTQDVATRVGKWLGEMSKVDRAAEAR